MDLLKKRAERFGIQLGSKVETVSYMNIVVTFNILLYQQMLIQIFCQVEMEEKKKKRLERFGLASDAIPTNGSTKVTLSKPDAAAAPAAVKPGRIPITAPTSTPSSKANLDAKKKQRAERFKTNTVVSAK